MDVGAGALGWLGRLGWLTFSSTCSRLCESRGPSRARSTAAGVGAAAAVPAPDVKMGGVVAARWRAWIMGGVVAEERRMLATVAGH